MQGRTFRVFVSSTFSDLKEERNALARHVYPRLRALCESRGFKFQAVDLRWGVRDEAAVDQQTMRICLDEIARCQELSPKPNFIVLLGDRYGWCPLPSVIDAKKEMDALRPHLATAAVELAAESRAHDGAALTDDETAALQSHLTLTDAALVEQWYLRDDNAVPAEYVLQPRRDAFKNKDVWGPIERRLHEALAGAADCAAVGATELQKYRASAVELEIMKGALEPKDAQEHVFGFFRSIANLDDVKAALSSHKASEAKALIDTVPGASWDEHAWSKQRQLHETLRDRIGKENIWRYDTSWNGGALDLARAIEDLPASATPPLKPNARIPDTPSLSAAWKEHSRVIADAAEAPFAQTTSLCEAVWKRLSRVIALQMDALERGQGDSLEVEMQAHADFAKKLAAVFRGRTAPLQQIATYLNAGAARPLVVCGESGSGKSALLARAIELARIAHPNALIVTRFVGAAPGASEARPLMRSVCLELAREFGGDEKAVPDAYDKLVNDFPTRLKLASPKRPVFLFIDALDQLSDSNDGRKLGWLPQALPPNVRVVVSTLPDPEYHCFPALKDRTQPEDFVQDLVEVAGMTAGEGREVLQVWLAGLPKPRKLTGEQPVLVLTTFQLKGLPLYLKLAFEEARRWHSYDGVPKDGLAPDVPSIIRAMFARLTGQHGEPVVSRALGFLAATRHGLSDDEMLALLWSDEEVRKDFDDSAHHKLPEGEAALPPVVWSRLYFDIDPYLAHRDVLGVGLLAFYHRQLAEVATELCLVADDREAEVHGQLADYFAKRWEGADRHALIELVPQLVASGRSTEARALLLTYEWLATKLAQTDIHMLLADYDELLLDRQEPAALVGGALRLSAHVLAVRTEELPGQLLGRLSDQPEELGAVKRDIRAKLHPPALVPVWSTLERSGGPVVSTWNLRSILSAVAMSRNGSRAIAATEDGAICIWDFTAVTHLRVMEPRAERLSRATEIPTWVALCSNGQWGISGSRDTEVVLWDVASGQAFFRFRGPEAVPATQLALSGDGRWAMWGTASGAVGLWNTQSGMLQHTTQLGPDTYDPIALSHDGSVGMWGGHDGMVAFWDARSQKASKGAVIWRRGHQDDVTAVAIAPDGKMALSASQRDSNIKVWSVEGAHAVQTVPVTHPAGVRSVAISEDGRSGLGCAWDKTIYIWPATGLGYARSFEGHDQEVAAFALSRDWTRALSGSSDRTVKLWDLASQAPTQRVATHTHLVTSIAVSDDGFRGISGGGTGDRTVKLWDPVSGSLIANFDGHNAGVTAVAMSGDGLCAISGDGRGVVRLLDLGARCWRCEFEDRNGVTAVALSRNGQRAIWAAGDTIRLCDVTSARHERDLVGHVGRVTCVAVDGDGRKIASGACDKTLRLWDAVSGEMLASFDAGEVTAVAISDDCRWAVTGSEDGRIRLWNLDSGRAECDFVGHTGQVTSVSLSADYLSVVSSSYDRTVKYWSFPSGVLIASATLDAVVSSAVFVAGGNLVLCGDWLGRIHRYELISTDHASLPVRAVSGQLSNGER